MLISILIKLIIIIRRFLSFLLNWRAMSLYQASSLLRWGRAIMDLWAHGGWRPRLLTFPFCLIKITRIKLHSTSTPAN